MSYSKAMKRNNRRNKAIQPCLFSTLNNNTRHKIPWLGGEWFKPGMDAERDEYIKQYQTETEKLLKENPNLIIID